MSTKTDNAIARVSHLNRRSPIARWRKVCGFVKRRVSVARSISGNPRPETGNSKEGRRPKSEKTSFGKVGLFARLCSKSKCLVYLILNGFDAVQNAFVERFR